jgi:phosphoglycerol transferase MdoB-like AlkP superfamily enzyme
MGRLNPISALWFWRGLKGYSITFASLFASVLLGFSISGELHHYLAFLGLNWIFVILIPVLIFKQLAKAEGKWIPDPKRRRSIARGILVGSIAVTLTISYVHSKLRTAGTVERAAERIK